MERQKHIADRGVNAAQELIHDVLQSTRKLMQMDIAYVTEFSAGYRVFRFIDSDLECAPVRVGDADPLEESYCARVADGRMPYIIHDTSANDEASCLPVTQRLAIGSHMAIPIYLSNGDIYGTFCCFSTKPDLTLGDSHIAAMRLFAGLISKALEREAARGFVFGDVRARVQRILDKRAYKIHYQPIVKLADDRIVGYEALARFDDDPTVPPDEWMRLAAQVGLRAALEYAVIQEALLGLSQLAEDVYLSLNISPETILEGDVARALDGLALHRLMLEITEHSNVEDYVRIAELLAPLREAGLRLAIDDAGAGFASFRHILKLQPDIIKLDRSLIQDIDRNVNSRALAAALCRFAEETGALIVAEGVESRSELQVLRDLQVDNAQGFLLGRPLPLPLRSA